MSFFRDLWSDLTDKRLLPVVAILIAGLIAVPVVLGRPSDSETPPPAPELASANDVASPGKVTLDPNGAKPEFTQRQSKRRDPFARAKVKVKKAITVGAGVGTALGGAKVDPGTSPGGGTTGTKTTPAEKPKPKTAVRRVSVKFGQDGALKTFANVAKFTPLPSESNPLLVFNGISADGKSATFLVSSDATPSGEGICDPDPENCQTLSLRAGETTIFEVPSGTGGITQYELRVLVVKS